MSSDSLLSVSTGTPAVFTIATVFTLLSTITCPETGIVLVDAKNDPPTILSEGEQVMVGRNEGRLEPLIAQTAQRSDTVIISYAPERPTLTSIKTIITELAERTQAGMVDADSISQTVIDSTIRLLEKLTREVEVAQLQWVEPHVSTEGNGDLMVRWSAGGRSLSLHFGADDRIEYLKAWGTDIMREMEDGELELTELFDLWCWITKH